MTAQGKGAAGWNTGLYFAGYEAPEGDEDAAAELRGLLREKEWADDALARENCTYANGRTLHENASEVLERVEDALIGFAVYGVSARAGGKS